jgi:hypothetical protein
LFSGDFILFSVFLHYSEGIIYSLNIEQYKSTQKESWVLRIHLSPSKLINFFVLFPRIPYIKYRWNTLKLEYTGPTSRLFFFALYMISRCRMQSNNTFCSPIRASLKDKSRHPLKQSLSIPIHFKTSNILL